MKKQMSVVDTQKCRRVRSNLLMQDVFVRDISIPKDVRTQYGAEQYYELQREPLKNGIGIQEVLRPVDYPITPESVDSHVASCDYKIDPAGVIARGQKRRNLGDVTDMQRVMQLDASAAMELYQNLKKVFEMAQVKKEELQSESESQGGNE